MSTNKDKAGILASKGLKLLSAAISRSAGVDNDQLKGDIESIMGIDISDPNVLENMTEEQILGLKDFESTHTDMLLDIITTQMETQENQLHLENTKSAREMQIAALQSGRSDTSINFIYWFGGVLVTFALIYIFLITWIPIPEANIRFADTSLGFILGTLLSTVINFFFGSSMKKSDIRSAVGEQPSFDRRQK